MVYCYDMKETFHESPDQGVFNSNTTAASIAAMCIILKMCEGKSIGGPNFQSKATWQMSRQNTKNCGSRVWSVNHLSTPFVYD